MTSKAIEQLDPNFRQRGANTKPGEIEWISAADLRLTVRGLAWFEENKGAFCRLPIRAHGVVRGDVWNLAQAPASARVVFRTDATRLAVRMENHHSANVPHFAATGSDGVFVYAGQPGRMKPWNMAAPAIGKTAVEKEIAANLEPGLREFTVYLPLYAPLKSLEIGLPAGSRVEAPAAHRLPRPVVFYGTSITQGGCASTSGGDFVSAVGRMLDLDVVNLGFSGNGRGEPEMARFISEIDAAAFVLDYCANTTVDGLQKTLQEFVAILRRQHPATPVILVSKIHYYGEQWAAGDAGSEHERQRDVVIRFYSEARAAEDVNIHFVDGWSLVRAGEDMALVDGAHPTSHGFALMAQRLAPALEYALKL